MVGQRNPRPNESRSARIIKIPLEFCLLVKMTHLASFFWCGVEQKKKLRKAGHQNTPYRFGVSVKIQIVIARKKFK